MTSSGEKNLALFETVLKNDISRNQMIKKQLTIKEETETENESLTLTATIKPDPLRQLLQCLNRAATTAQVFSITEDIVYLSYSDNNEQSKVLIDLRMIDRTFGFLKSCVIEEDDDDDGTEEVKTFQEQEMEKQKLLYEQNRLANRGAAETVLLYISVSKGRLIIHRIFIQSKLIKKIFFR